MKISPVDIILALAGLAMIFVGFFKKEIDYAMFGVLLCIWAEISTIYNQLKARAND